MFPVAGGKLALIRNHELTAHNPQSGPFGRDNALLGRIAGDRIYDFGKGMPCLGGTSTIIIDAATARRSRAHHDTNVLTLGARITGAEAAVDIVQAWLEAEFEGGRHARRVAKHAELEDTRRTEAEHAAAR